MTTNGSSAAGGVGSSVAESRGLSSADVAAEASPWSRITAYFVDLHEKENNAPIDVRSESLRPAADWSAPMPVIAKRDTKIGSGFQAEGGPERERGWTKD